MVGQLKLQCTYCPKPAEVSLPDASGLLHGRVICPSCTIRLVLLNGGAR